jgi:hypothetical protein
MFIDMVKFSTPNQTLMNADCFVWAAILLSGRSDASAGLSGLGIVFAKPDGRGKGAIVKRLKPGGAAELSGNISAGERCVKVGMMAYLSLSFSFSSPTTSLSLSMSLCLLYSILSVI